MFIKFHSQPQTQRLLVTVMFTCQDLKTLNGDNKKGPERGLIFRMGCRRRTDFAAAAVVAVAAADAAAVVVLDSAVAPALAG